MNRRRSKNPPVVAVIGEHHKAQKEIFDAVVRFKLAICGRRFGKTTLALEVALKKAWDKDRSKTFVIAPTRDMVKDLYWIPLKDRLRAMNWRFTKNETELRIQRRENGSIIQLKSADNIDRLRGRGLDLAVLDELADMDEGIWAEVIRPALADRQGDALLIGTPKGRSWVFDLWEMALKYPASWRRWLFRTIDSPFVPAEEVEAARADMDERTFRQEFEASFEDYSGLSYPYFQTDANVRTLAFSRDWPLTVACDFNLDPCIWIIGQDVGGELRFLKELRQRQTDVFRMAPALKKVLEELVGSEEGAREFPVLFYGDYQHGKAKALSSVASTWEILKREFAFWRVEFRVKPNPRIIDRRNAVNSRLLSLSGNVRLFVDPTCKELIKDFQQVTAEMEEVEAKQGERTHAVAAVGYQINFEYPVRPQPVGRQL